MLHPKRKYNFTSFIDMEFGDLEILGERDEEYATVSGTAGIRFSVSDDDVECDLLYINCCGMFSHMGRDCLKKIISPLGLKSLLEDAEGIYRIKAMGGAE